MTTKNHEYNGLLSLLFNIYNFTVPKIQVNLTKYIMRTADSSSDEFTGTTAGSCP